MNKSFKAQQGGFTLIELIVVIVILGILAATALPKFASLSGEARLASLNAAKGSLSATSAMTHGKYLVAPPADKLIAVEGTKVTMNTASGYPSVASQDEADALAAAAGLSSADYKVYIKGAGGDKEPKVGDNQLAIVPSSIVGTTAASKCFVLYEAATAPNAAPVITVGALGSATAVAACE
jgi:MSHA pilin protein MshA